MLKYKGTYEIICPEDIGFERVDENGIVLGKLRCAFIYPTKRDVCAIN